MESNNKLNEIIEEKNKVNEFTKNGNFIEAEKGYKEIIDKINNLPKEELNEEILNQKKLILSNLSLSLTKQKKTKEAKKCDIEIIRKLDNKFTKSYARLINNYLDEKNVTCARYYHSLMINECQKEEINKFSDIIQKLEIEIKKKDTFIKDIELLKQISI
jgi:hypothetical protein